MIEIGRNAISGPFWPTAIRAVFAGWLIALMIWLLPSARSARLLVIMLLTYIVALGGFSHVIAGSVEFASPSSPARPRSGTISRAFSYRPFWATPWGAWRWSRCSIMRRSRPNCRIENRSGFARMASARRPAAPRAQNPKSR